jgi:hypothetical protein
MFSASIRTFTIAPEGERHWVAEGLSGRTRAQRCCDRDRLRDLRRDSRITRVQKGQRDRTHTSETDSTVLDVRLLVARCEVQYTGRLTARLPEAVRLLMFKADGSFLVHEDAGGFRPLNWIRTVFRPHCG